jgi:hypothetical protein
MNGPGKKTFQLLTDCIEKKKKAILSCNDDFSMFMICRTLSMHSDQKAILANNFLADLENLSDQQLYDLCLKCLPKISISSIFKENKFLKKQTE